MTHEERDELLCTIVRKLDAQHGQIESLHVKINFLTQRTVAMSDSVAAEITSLQASVANETTVNASAITLINGFAAQLAAAVAAAQGAGATPDQLAALSTLSSSVSSNASSLAAAVAANTPAASSTGTTAASTSQAGTLATGATPSV